MLMSLYDASVEGQPNMPANYSLDRKIEALNLLDQHDGDFHLVKSRLKIPLKTLRGWRADEDALRHKYEDRQYRHFANIKLELLKDMFESCRDIMKRIKTGDHEGIAVSQLAYTLSTLISHSKQLEEAFEDLAPNPQKGTERANRIEYVYNDKVQDAPPWTERNPEKPRSLQSVGLREALGQIGIGQNRHSESRPPRTQTLLVDRPQLPDGEPDLARSGIDRQTPGRRRYRQKRTAH